MIRQLSFDFDLGLSDSKGELLVGDTLGIVLLWCEAGIQCWWCCCHEDKIGMEGETFSYAIAKNALKDVCAFVVLQQQMNCISFQFQAPEVKISVTSVCKMTPNYARELWKKNSGWVEQRGQRKKGKLLWVDLIQSDQNWQNGMGISTYI